MSEPTPALSPAQPTRIVLTGFMGAGKTTVGALLAEKLGWQFVDSDRVVEAEAGMTIAEIFGSRGEAAFREMEAGAIREAARGERMVIAVGGGALESAATRDFLANLAGCAVVFLEAPLETMIARCAAHMDGPVRPVLADRDRLAERWSRRLPWYREAHLTVDTGGLAPEGVTECILRKINPGAANNLRDHEEAVRGREKSGVPV